MEQQNAYTRGIDGTAREFLTFSLGREEYGLDILKVQEIRGYENPTAIANAPAYIKGVVNLRGTIVPIVDLRIKFNLSQVHYNEFTVVIIITTQHRVVGVVVDGVSDVAMLQPEQIKPAPQFGTVLDTNYITGIGTVHDRMLILVEIDQVIGNLDIQVPDLAA